MITTGNGVNALGHQGEWLLVLAKKTTPLSWSRVVRQSAWRGVTQGHGLLHGEETDVFADAGYQGAAKRPEATGVAWHVAMRPGKRRVLDRSRGSHQLVEQIEKIKAGIRAKVEHPFRVIKCQLGFVKVRYRGLAKNTAQLVTLFALSNLWTARKRLIEGMPG